MNMQKEGTIAAEKIKVMIDTNEEAAVQSNFPRYKIHLILFYYYVVKFRK